MIPVFVGCATSRSASTTPRTPVHATESAHGIPIVILSGDADALGKSQGDQLRPQIKGLHDAYMKALFQHPTSRRLAIENARAYEPFILPEYLTEIRALADSSGMDDDSALLSQCFLDILPMVACSTLALPASASVDGVARMARNLDFMSMGVADKASMILIFKPAGRYHFAAITWPGLVGVLTGMNQHGLTIANIEVTRLPTVAHAMPYPLLYRTILERCRTVDEAIALLETTPRQTPNNLMLMDEAGNRAVVEISPHGIVVRRGQDNEALASTNHQRGEDHDKPGRCWRYDRMRESTADAFGQLDEPAIQRIIQSVSVPRFTLQSMVFEPSRRMIHLSIGASAGKGPYHPIDLGALMR